MMNGPVMNASVAVAVAGLPQVLDLQTRFPGGGTAAEFDRRGRS
jgi:hypothetical protein